MQKTTKNLLTKIFALLTVIFCVFALALGAIGCAKEETKAVAKVSVNGNVLTVTYLDGTTDNLTVEGEKYVECGHDAYVRLSDAMVAQYDEDEEIRSDVCRATIYGCTVCNHIYATYEKHVLGADDATTNKFVEGLFGEEKPYCDDEGSHDGYKGQKCQFCDYKEGEIIPFEDHNWQEIKLIKDEFVDECTTTWYSGKKVCLDCGITQLVANPAKGHKFENIRVGAYATKTVAATLIGDCDQCNKTGLLVKELYKLDTAEAAAEYEKTVGNTVNAGHYATYTYTYEEVEYTVSENFFEEHQLVFNDYTAEKYPGIVIMTGETVVCNDGQYAKAVKTCDECKKGVNIQVKKAHTIPEDAEYKSTTATCTDPGKEYFECTVCKELVGFPVAAYGHNYTKLEKISPEYEVQGQKYIDVTLSCTRENGGVVCGHETTLEKIQNYVKVDPDCSNDGSITYTTADGQTKSITLYANGEHVLEGYEGTVKAGAELDYADVKDNKGIIYMSDSIPATCGDSAEVVFVCKTCGKGVAATVARNHVKINEEVTKKPDCVEEGILSFNCAYEDCQYHTVKTTEPIAKIGHAFEFVSATSTHVTVKCIEDCKYETATAFEIKKYVEERDMTCKDYADGKTNYNEYTFIVDDTNDGVDNGVEYSVQEAIENTVHVLNGKKVNKGDEFVKGTANIIEMSGTMADCVDKGEGTFVCELCGKGVSVVLKGECQVPADLAAVTQTDDIDCEKAAYKYWVCSKPGCGERHDLEKVADATGHNFVTTKIEAGIAYVECQHKAENCECGASKCNDCAVSFQVTLSTIANTKVTVETCETVTDTYTYIYKNGDYEQEVEIVDVKTIGTHDWLMNGNELAVCKYVEVVDGEVVKIGYGNFCKRCGQYKVLAWEPPVAEWVD